MMDRLRVVVADDEGLIAMDVAEMLTESGYDVVGIGKDGVEALNTQIGRASCRERV